MANKDSFILRISKYGVRVLIDVREMKECDIVKNSKDSLGISDWVNIAAAIKKQYDDYFGFVILHGTDTMSYTASALSFMFENLGKSVILTGSQVFDAVRFNNGKNKNGGYIKYYENNASGSLQLPHT